MLPKTEEQFKVYNDNFSMDRHSTAQNRYCSAAYTSNDSFCLPAYNTEPRERSDSKPTKDSNLLMAKLVWRFKKQVAAAIYEKHRFMVQKCFDKWKQGGVSQEHILLRNQVLQRVVMGDKTRKMRHAFIQLRHHSRQQEVKEAVNIKLMQRWKKRFVFKVFKILRNQKLGDKKEGKQMISKKMIKNLQR
jgi:hypothetical protein